MKESSTQETNSRKERNDLKYTGNFPVLLNFLLRNGQTLRKTAFINEGEFENLKENILAQLTNPDKTWFYFIETTQPYISSLIRIDEVASFTLVECDEVTESGKKKIIDKRILEMKY